MATPAQRQFTLEEIWLVEPEAVHVTVWRREGDEWTRHDHRDEGEQVALLDGALPLRAVYERAVT